MKLHYPFGQPPEGVDVLWRCEAKSYSVIIDALREEYGTTGPRLELRYFYVVKRTNKGAWIRKDFNFSPREKVELDRSKHQLVMLNHNKAFARENVALAVRDFAARRKRQIVILEGQLQRAKRELDLTTDNPRIPEIFR